MDSLEFRSFFDDPVVLAVLFCLFLSTVPTCFGFVRALETFDSGVGGKGGGIGSGSGAEHRTGRLSGFEKNSCI